MITHVVFDWNGTLLADTEACMIATNHVLEAFGGRTVDLKAYRATFVVPIINFYTQHGCSHDTLMSRSAEASHLFHNSYEPRAARVRTRRGALQLLAWLQAHHITSLILSNHTVEGIAVQLRRLRLERYIDTVLANDTHDAAMKGRNKEQKLRLYMLERRLNPSNVVIVGDSPEEIEIGRATGVRSIAITGGYCSTSQLRLSKPDALVGSLSQIPLILDSFNAVATTTA